MANLHGGKRIDLADKGKRMISIIIVTKNAEKYLVPCLSAIANQRFQNLEVIIFDGDSTDNTVKLLKENEHLITYWQSEQDNGIYEAMNEALKKATGNWLFFLGVDDLLLPTFSDMAEKLKKKNTIYTGDCITDTGEILNGSYTAYGLTKVNICHQGIFYPSAVFDKYKYQPKYRVYADHVLNMQCWGDSDFPKQYFPVFITRYHLSGFSSFTKDEAFELDKPALIKKYLGYYLYWRYRIKQWKEKRKRHKQQV